MLAALALICSACSSGPPQPKPQLHILTGLPLFWGEGDVSDIVQKRSDAAPSIKLLSGMWTVVPLDIASPQTLRDIKTLLLAQPPLLSPAELVALDAWVRRGGRIVILADPDLRWPQRRPLGDPRRAPPATLLSPLYRHWGLDLRPDAVGAPPRIAKLGAIPLDLPGSGAWVTDQRQCRQPDPAVAVCSLDQGVAVLVADADFLQPGEDAGNPARAVDALNRLLLPEKRMKSTQ